MTYIMRAGTLYFNDIVSARIKGAFTGSEKKIYSANDSILMYTDIANLEVIPHIISGAKSSIASMFQPPTVPRWKICITDLPDLLISLYFEVTT